MKKKWLLLAVLLITLVSLGLRQTTTLFAKHEVGTAIDSLNGVKVYYNGSVSHVKDRNVAPDGYNIGLRWQCVEFVKRYYYEFYHHKMPDSYGHAKDFFDQSLADGAYNKKRNLNQYTNPSTSRPQVGDLIIFNGHPLNFYGHVAIVSKVADKEIEIIQQNPGPMAPSREKIPLENKDGKYHLNYSLLLGWLRKK
ncbi:MAG: hypothetical protein RLZZ77_1217 [Bacteroidota bacterium]|jgi:surface antigen